MAKYSGAVEGQWEPLEGEKYYPDTMNRQDTMLRKLQEVSDNLPEGEVVGALLYFPVADGNAIYRVEKASPLTLAHVPAGDAWHIPEAHLRGIRLEDVKRQLASAKKIKRMFG